MEPIKSQINDSLKLFENKSEFQKLTDTIHGVFEKGKDKIPDWDSIEKKMNEALEKVGAKYRVQKKKLEEVLGSLSENKATRTKEEISKSIKDFLEEKKCEVEDQMK